MSQENDLLAKQLADETVQSGHPVSPEDAATLREWIVEGSLKIRDADRTSLGGGALSNTVERPNAMAVHSGYGESGRRA